MKKIYLLSLLIVIDAANAFGQSAAKPSPTPFVDNDVVKISTNLVQVDVTVLDSKGKIVRDLRPDEVEIYQNGKKQEISNFSFVSIVRESTEGVATKPKPQTELIVPSAPVKAEAVTRSIALVVDDLNLSYLSTYEVQKALKKFVDEQMLDGDLVAIIRTGAGIGALQQFTNDKRQLYAAIDKIHYSAIGTGNIGSFAPLQYKGEVEASSPLNTDTHKKADESFQASVFATGTMGALNFVVRGMAELPGRKSIMLFSDGFAPFAMDMDGTGDSRRIRDAIVALADKANRASVVIYTIDPRGLVATGLTGEDDTGVRTAAEIRQAETDRLTSMVDSQNGLKFLANETGGTAFINDNNVSGGIRKILDDQSYYLIAYEPDDETFDANKRHFNDLNVKVKRPGTTVRYRSGFLNVADEKQPKPTDMKAGDRLVNALTSPFAVNDIPLRLNALFVNNPQAGSYIRSFLHIRSQDISFEDTPDGGKKATLDIIAAAFGDNGNATDHLSRSFTITIKKDQLESFMKSGFPISFEFPIKKAGAFQLRVAIRDHKSEKVGSANQFIEVPDLKKNRLTLSGVALNNMSFASWKMRNAVKGKGQPVSDGSDAMSDTANRQFKRGTVLDYALSIYNARPGSGLASGLTSEVKLFRDGKQFFDGKPLPVTSLHNDSRSISLLGSFNIGPELAAGDYVMAIVVKDTAAKEKQRTAVQFVQFEIVE